MTAGGGPGGQTELAEARAQQNGPLLIRRGAETGLHVTGLHVTSEVCGTSQAHS
jgi:hypothetical protein